MAARHLKTGRAGEDAAAEFLRTKGLKVVVRNWRSGGLELDLICRDGDTLVFVEVKTRGRGSLGRPSDGLGGAKQAKLARAASLYLSETDSWDAACRFDLVSVTETGEGMRLEHLPHAFDLTAALGGGHATWQPW